MFTAAANHVGKTCGQRRLAKTPSPRDLRAMELAAQGLTQREAARVLGCSQPTVLRGIARTTKWIASLAQELRGTV
jgi:hypothetical protein